MIVIDTSVLIDALTGPRRSLPAMRRAVERGERLLIPTLVLYEWERGPRTDGELRDQEALLPGDRALPFGAEEARRAAALYRAVKRPRGRELDIAIAAVAIGHRAVIWTLNLDDFRGIPGVVVSRPT